MRNSIITLLLAAFAVAFIGCGKDAANTETTNGPGIEAVGPSCEVLEIIPLTEPRYGCDGKMLPDPKFIGLDSFYVKTPAPIITVSDDALNADGYFFDPGKISSTSVRANGNTVDSYVRSSGNEDSGFPSWLKGLWWFLLALILLALAGWFLWWLFNQTPTSRNVGGANAVGTNNNNPNVRNINIDNEDTTILLRIGSHRTGDDTSASLKEIFASTRTLLDTLSKAGGGKTKIDFEDANVTTSVRLHVHKK